MIARVAQTAMRTVPISGVFGRDRAGLVAGCAAGVSCGESVQKIGSASASCWEAGSKADRLGLGAEQDLVECGRLAGTSGLDAPAVAASRTHPDPAIPDEPPSASASDTDSATE